MVKSMHLAINYADVVAMVDKLWIIATTARLAESHMPN